MTINRLMEAHSGFGLPQSAHTLFQGLDHKRCATSLQDRALRITSFRWSSHVIKSREESAEKLKHATMDQKSKKKKKKRKQKKKSDSFWCLFKDAEKITIVVFNITTIRTGGDWLERFIRCNEAKVVTSSLLYRRYIHGHKGHPET